MLTKEDYWTHFVFSTSGEGNSTFCKVLTRIILVAALIVCMIATGVRIWIASPPDTAHLYIDRPTQG